MRKNAVSGAFNKISAQPRLHQQAKEIQQYGTVNLQLPLELDRELIDYFNRAFKERRSKIDVRVKKAL